jgi:cell wall-associated NlpC family hydrolase
MFSPLHSHDSRTRCSPFWRWLCRLLALALLFASPGALGQVTSKQEKSKASSQTKSQTGKSQTGSKTKSTTSRETKSQPAAKTKSEPSTQTKSKPSTPTGSQTANKEKTKEPVAPTKPETAKEKESKESGAPESEAPESEAPGQTAQPSPSPFPSPTQVSSLKPEDVRGFYNNPPEVQELLTAALELTERNLGYIYGSADPARGGMDCSGTIFYLLQKMGMSDVPRSASQQYVWVRRSDAFRPVVSTRLDSFELDALRPGNLLFWTGTYSANVDPPVTHTMIYLGKARSDGRPLMVGASDGRTFQGEKKFGVSVFDFVIPKANGKNPIARFIGYAEIPR